MRRKDKEITDLKEINKIIMQADFCNLAMSKDNVPYVIPMNFGYHENCIYLHSADKGLKIDILKKNPNVCIGIVHNARVEKLSDVCKTTMKYKSVIIFGKAELLSDNFEKGKALEVIVSHYYGNTSDFKERELNFNQSALEKLIILKVKIEKLSCKKV